MENNKPTTESIQTTLDSEIRARSEIIRQKKKIEGIASTKK